MNTTPTKEQTQQALNDSIAHWERMANGTYSPDESIYGKDCALCSLFLKNNCDGCPVKERTGHISCIGSPWKEAAMNYDGNDTPEFKVAATKMLNFLESLKVE